MGLIEQQKFLAKLYTDDTLRKSFIKDPAFTGSANQLSEIEIRELLSIIETEIECFAESLYFKRLHEVERLLYLTARELKHDFRTHFKVFSNTFIPDQVKKHLQDALEFSEFLESNSEIEPWVKDLAKFERCRLEFHNFERRIVAAQLKYDIRERSKDPLASEPALRRTFAVWLRAGNRTFHFIR
ncbi:MAG: hypothetical protein KIS76_01225 [Pyrinomonadaceae bacterium]|nr:hypothetical protein [Pyrinomonadaceae bacterium]